MNTWNTKPLQAGQRTYTGRIVTDAMAAEWARFSALIAQAKHPAARAYLTQQRAQLTQRGHA